MTYPLTSRIATAHSFLLVPANQPDHFARALASPADVVVIDLADSVPAPEKALVRDQLLMAYSSFTPQERTRLVLRLNASGTPWLADDLALLQYLALQGLAGVMVPRAETVESLLRVAQALGPDGAVLPLIESVAGLDAADALAHVPQVLRLVFGSSGFQADLGLACAADEAELQPVRLAVALAARRAGQPRPLEGLTPGMPDPARLQAAVARAHRSGFGGKLCASLDEVPLVRAVFSPAVIDPSGVVHPVLRPTWRVVGVA
jgi:citrate lyase subunit beta/citryl-CoA lyase